MSGTLALRRIIVIGASAGGVEALCALVRELPKDWPAAAFVVLHVGPHSALPEILDRCIGDGVVKFPIDGEEISPGKVYIATPAHHLTLHDETHVRLTKAHENHRFRPSVDFLFQSAARTYGRDVIAVVLTGMLDDGSVGITEIKLRGGIAVVQDPDDAQFPSMPHHAIQATSVDYCVPLLEIPGLLKELVASTPDNNEQAGMQIAM